MNLIKKYNVQGPRYTSYPTVPYWDKSAPDSAEWARSVKNAFDVTNSKDGISIYIHLPYCESLCTYCGCNTRITVNHAVETPYINAVLKEWKMYSQLFGNEKVRIKEIHLGGGTPTFFSPENLKKLIDGILKDALLTPDAEFSFEAHPGNTTHEHLAVLYSLGFKRLSLGIQDFDEKVQDIINRYQSIEQVKDITEYARKLGYTSVNYDLIYGLPLQKKESVKETIRKVIELQPDRIAYYSYAHVPWIKPGQRKFTENDLPVDNEKRELYELGRALFLENGYAEIGMDHFSLPTDTLYKAFSTGKLHRNFMGYTHNYTQLMIGLGVSSISDSWNAFVQNAKVVEEYIGLLEKDVLPIFRGHFLNEEDLCIRKHILNIMTKLHTMWEDNENTMLLHEIKERLAEPIADGLVVIDGNKFNVTNKGIPFIRNICMAFDARLWENIPQTTLFSSTV